MQYSCNNNTSIILLSKRNNMQQMFEALKAHHNRDKKNPHFFTWFSRPVVEWQDFFYCNVLASGSGDFH